MPEAYYDLNDVKLLPMPSLFLIQKFSVTETWLISNFSSPEIFLPRHTIIRAERTVNNSSSRHGGVFIGISSEFNFTVNDLSVSLDN